VQRFAERFFSDAQLKSTFFDQLPSANPQQLADEHVGVHHEQHGRRSASRKGF
jgi:hypothetical protein